MLIFCSELSQCHLFTCTSVFYLAQLIAKKLILSCLLNCLELCIIFLYWTMFFAGEVFIMQHSPVCVFMFSERCDSCFVLSVDVTRDLITRWKRLPIASLCDLQKQKGHLIFSCHMTRQALSRAASLLCKMRSSHFPALSFEKTSHPDSSQGLAGALCLQYWVSLI